MAGTGYSGLCLFKTENPQDPNHVRYHESLNNLTPADVYDGRGDEILEQRKQIKRATMAMRRGMHYDRQTIQINLMS